MSSSFALLARRVTLTCGCSTKRAVKGAEFVTAAYTPVPTNSEGQANIILGMNDGSIVAYDPAKDEFLNFGQKSYIMNG